MEMACFVFQQGSKLLVATELGDVAFPQSTAMGYGRLRSELYDDLQGKRRR
jgi:hypothetical protein